MDDQNEPQSPSLDVEAAVRDRYSAASAAREAALCCPIDYDPQYLAVIPQEVLDRDYGCGDPSRYVRPGETVLDLGSGGGKICFIASQIVGPEGRVIGVDMNDDMLALARAAAPQVAEAIGYANVEFRRGRIQDLALDLDALDRELAAHPVTSAAEALALEERIARLEAELPLIPSDSIDVIVSNCVLNLVKDEHKDQLVAEMFRVLKRGGRIAVSDIVSDEHVPEELSRDPVLWSGCISGAFQELELLEKLEAQGFYGITLDKLDDEPWQTVEGIEFRSATVMAWKGKEGPCEEANQAVIYKGPFKKVLDDDGHPMERGVRTAVCAKTFGILTSAPYAEHFIAVEPREPVPEAERLDFDCSRTAPRHPRDTKGQDYALTTAAGDCCAPEDCC